MSFAHPYRLCRLLLVRYTDLSKVSSDCQELHTIPQLPHPPGRREDVSRRHKVRREAVGDEGAEAVRSEDGQDAGAGLREDQVRLRRVLGVRGAHADGAREPPGRLLQDGAQGRPERRCGQHASGA